MSTESLLRSLTQQFNIYLGLFILVPGVVGGIFNLIIFTSLRTFRETTCALYLTTISLVNLVQLLVSLLGRVLDDGFHISVRTTSWQCKIYVYTVQWCALTAMTNICLAALDQFLSMSNQRRWSQWRLAKRSICISLLFWCLYGIPVFFYWDISSGTCRIVNYSFGLYISRFHFPVLLGFLPIVTMSTFASLAYYSARTLESRQVNIVRLSRDRQLTAMTLVHVLYVIFTTLPFSVFFSYSQSQQSKDPEQIARTNLIYSLTILIDYASFAVSN